MKTIKIYIIFAFLLASYQRCYSQLEFIVDQIIGEVIDGVASEMGNAAGSSAINNMINSNSKKKTLDYSAYKRTISSMLNGAGPLAFGAMNNGVSKNVSSNSLDYDRNYVYTGEFQIEGLSQYIELCKQNNSNSYSKLTAGNKKNLLNTSDNIVMKNDLYEDLPLLSYLQNNPNSLSVYLNIIKSPLRKDIGLLRFLSERAFILSKPWFMINNGYKWGKYDDYTQIIEGTSCVLRRNGKNVCEISKDDEIYKISRLDESRDIFNLYPCSSAIYVCDRCQTWQTDNYGRVIKATIVLSNKPSKTKVDMDLSSELKALKASYNSLGLLTKNSNSSNLMDFYLIPLAYGGRQDYINTLAVNGNSIKNSSVSKLDKKYLSFAKKQNTVVRTIELTYPDIFSLEPSFIRVVYSCNDKKHEVRIENK